MKQNGYITKKSWKSVLNIRNLKGLPSTFPQTFLRFHNRTQFLDPWLPSTSRCERLFFAVHGSFKFSQHNVMNIEHFRFNLDVNRECGPVIQPRLTEILLLESHTWKAHVTPVIEWYPIRAYKSHEHITPFLATNHSPGHDSWFLWTSRIQYSAWLLSDIITPTLTYSILSCAKNTSEVVYLQGNDWNFLSLYGNALFKEKSMHLR